MWLIADFNPNGHHATYIANLIREGSRGPFLLSTAIWHELAPDIRDTPGVAIHHIPTQTHDAETQVDALLDHLDSHPDITSAIHLTIDEVFRSLFKRLPRLIGRPRRHISGVWLQSNLFYQRHEDLKSRVKFILFVLRVVAYLTVARRAKLFFLNEELARYLRTRATVIISGPAHMR